MVGSSPGAFTYAINDSIYLSSESYHVITKTVNVTYEVEAVEDDLAALKVMADRYTCNNKELVAFFGTSHSGYHAISIRSHMVR